MGAFSLTEIDPDAVVYMVGIGGAGMSAIATVLLQMGYRVEGSDLKDSSYVRRIREMGAVVGLGHSPDNLRTPAVIVRSSAVARSNPEIVEAEKRGIPVIDRARMLAAIMAIKEGIAIAGTHGKTTTASMMAQVLMSCGEDPSFLIGAELNDVGSNARYGTGRFLVAEADESDGSLLFLRPAHTILTNIELDHLDYYRDIQHTEEVFAEYLSLLPAGGVAVLCGDDPRVYRIGTGQKERGVNLFYYGQGAQNDYIFENWRSNADGCSYSASLHGKTLADVKTRVPGLHNIYNSLAVLALSHRLEQPLDRVVDGLARFGGVRRRFEQVGSRDGITVIDDYAHHPTEVEAVLSTASTVNPSRIVSVFQPHRYSRTRMLAPAFGEAFSRSGLVIITDVYGAGEEPEPGVSGELIVESIKEHDPAIDVLYVPSRENLAKEVAGLLREGDMVITMGAGDITLCGREILGLLGANGDGYSQ